MRDRRPSRARTTGFSLLAALACNAAPARAADDDTQLWLTLTGAVPLADHAAASFDLSQRFREGNEQLLMRASADFEVAPQVDAGGGLTYVEYAAGHEIRPHQQVTISAGPLAFRTRVEERVFAGNDRFQLRLRERVQATQKLGSATRLSETAEVLYIARPENGGDESRLDSVRFGAAAQHRFSKAVDASLGYLLIYSPRDGAPDRVSHVPQMTLTIRG